MLTLASISLMCAVVAFVYAEILIQPGEILNPWCKLLCKWLVKIEIINCREERKESWFFKPLIGCSKCVAGQFALWSYLFSGMKYNIGHHAFVICLAVLLTLCLKAFYNSKIK